MSAKGRTPKKRFVVWFGSEILRGKRERTRVKRDLREGKEPRPRYATGKFWED